MRIPMKVERSWKHFFRTGYLYRVSMIAYEPIVDFESQYSHAVNGLFDRHLEDNWHHHCHLKPEVRLWLLTCLKLSDWIAEFPRYKGDTMLGIKFRRKKHIVLFKLRFG